MAQGNRRGGGRRRGDSDAEDRDLLVGRPEQAADTGEEARSGRGPSATAGAEADAAQDAMLAGILDRLRVMKARLDVLQALPEASDEATVALKRVQAGCSRPLPPSLSWAGRWCSARRGLRRSAIRAMRGTRMSWPTTPPTSRRVRRRREWTTWSCVAW